MLQSNETHLLLIQGSVREQRAGNHQDLWIVNLRQLLQWGFRTPVRFYEDSNFGKSDRRFYEDRLKSGRVTTAAGLVLDLAVLADGIGGESAGERAAEMTVEEVFECARTSTETDIPLLLQTALEFANAKVYFEAQNERHKYNMGSTAAVAAIHNRRLYIANIGDSRIYLVRGRKLRQLTVDHTWANEMVKDGSLTAEEAARHPRRDELMRSVGYEPQVMVDLGLYLDDTLLEQDARKAQGMPLRPGDRILLCSDGLTKARRKGGGHFVEGEEIVGIISESPGPEAAKLLVDKALERNTDDNVSVILAEVPDVKRPMHIPKAARIAFTAILVLGVVGLAILIPILRNRDPVAPTLPPGEISQHQARIAEIEGLDFEFIPVPDQPPRPVAPGDFIDFVAGAILRTGEGEGYVFIGLPGRAELFIGPQSQVRFVSSDATGVVIQVDAGRIILNLPPEFPAGHSVTALSAAGARTWINGSKMCLSYQSSKELLRMECVEDRCLYENNGPSEIQAGYHANFRGPSVLETGPGLQAEGCQFVPGVVATSTATALPSPTSAVTASPTTAIPTMTSQVTRTPAALASPTATLFIIPTSTRPDEETSTPLPTPTQTPGTPASSTPASNTPASPTPIISDTPIGKPTNTPRPTNTLKPTNTPRPTNPIKPTNTVKPTNTPAPPKATNTPRPTSTTAPPKDTNTPRVHKATNTPIPAPSGTTSARELSALLAAFLFTLTFLIRTILP